VERLAAVASGVDLGRVVVGADVVVRTAEEPISAVVLGHRSAVSTDAVSADSGLDAAVGVAVQVAAQTEEETLVAWVDQILAFVACLQQLADCISEDLACRYMWVVAAEAAGRLACVLDAAVALNAADSAGGRELESQALRYCEEVEAMVHDG
jgi:hypothetical protein